MRVTENSNYESVRGTLQRGRERLENLQTQSTTFKKINTPSDAPTSAGRLLEMRTHAVNLNQFQLNASTAESFLNNSDGALEELSEIVVRAKEVALGQANAASSTQEARVAVAEEVTQLISQAMAAGNRRLGDRYLFSGFKTQTPAVDAEGAYLGDQGQMMLEIANSVFLQMNIPGDEIFNTHPTRSDPTLGIPTVAPENVNLFDELQNFRISLLTGSLDGIRDTLEKFDQINSKIISVRAKIGSRIQGLLSTQAALEKTHLTESALSSVLEDADMVQVISDLGKEETVFRSSLASSKRLLQPTLLDFLK